MSRSQTFIYSLKNPHPKQWSAREVVGSNKIKEAVNKLLSDAKTDGYFTNHSLRCSGGSHLFQVGV